MTVHMIKIRLENGDKIDGHVAALQEIQDTYPLSDPHRQIMQDTLSVFRGMQRALRHA